MEDSDKIYDFVGEGISFGMQDYDGFWEVMADNLECAELDDFIQVIECFKAYKEWIPEDVFDRLLELADEVDEDIRPELEEIIETWGSYSLSSSNDAYNMKPTSLD